MDIGCGLMQHLKGEKFPKVNALNVSVSKFETMKVYVLCFVVEIERMYA